MRKITWLTLLILYSLFSKAQIFTKPNNSYGNIYNRGSFDSTIYLPTGCGVPTSSAFLFSEGFSGFGQKLRKAAIYYDSCGGLGYIWNPSAATWSVIGSGSGGGSTFVNSRDTITCTACPFTVGKIVYETSTAWDLADTIIANTFPVAGMISKVFDANTFEITYEGQMSLPANGLVRGNAQYLTLNGNFTDVPPTSTQIPIGWALDNDHFVVQILTGWSPSGGGSGGGTLTGGSGLSPLFTNGVSGSTLTFTQSNVPARTVFANFGGSLSAPSFDTLILASAMFANQGNSTVILHGNASGNPSWGAINLASDVTGILSIPHGGTGTATPSLVQGTFTTLSGSWPNSTIDVDTTKIHTSNYNDGRYAPKFTLTTTGTSGAATYSANVLNIPQYAGGGGGGSSTVKVYAQSGMYAANDTTVQLGTNPFLENVHLNGSNTYGLYLDSLFPTTPNDKVTDKALTWDIRTHQLKSIFRYLPHIQRFFYDTATTTQTAISGLQTVKLSDGKLVGVATGSGTNPSDGASSSLWAYDSYDNGHTFVNKRNIIPLSGVSGALAIYTPSIVLIPGDTLLMVFTVATATGPTYVSSLWQSKSYRGISWSAPIKIYDGGGSKYLNDASGRMIRTFKGTIIQPFEIWRFDPVLSPNSTSGFDGALAISNDNGSHWNVHTNVFVAPDSGWVESGLYQTNDSILWSYARSPRGGWAVGSYCTTNDTSYTTWQPVYRLNLPNPNANVYIYHNPYNDVLIAATNEITSFPQGSDRHKLVLSELAYSQHNKDGHNRPAVTNSNWIWKQVCILDTALGSGQMFGVNQIRNLNDTAYEMNYISLSSTNAWISMKAAIVPVTYFPTEFKEYNPEFDPQLYLHRHKDSLGQQMIILDWENNYTDNTKNHPRWVYSLSNNVNSATTFTPSLQSSSSSNSLSGLVTNIDDSASSVATSIWDINTNAIGLQENTLPLIHLHTAGLNVLDIYANKSVWFGTTGIGLPTGTTAQRATLTGGLRFNSTLNQFEAYSTEHSNNSWATPWMSGTGLQMDANYKTLNLTSVGEVGTISMVNADASATNFNSLQFKKSISGSFNIGTGTGVGQIDLSTMAQLKWLGSPNTTGGLTTLDMMYQAYNAAGTKAERWRVTAEGSMYLGQAGTPTLDPASIFTMKSTTQGFRPPSMTTAQVAAISSPTGGTVAFATDGVNDLLVRKTGPGGSGGWFIPNSEAIHNYAAKTTTTAIGQYDYYIDCTSGSFTATLPDAVTVGAGKEYFIKNSGAGTITMATTSSETIDGSAPGTIATLGQLKVISDGANWKSDVSSAGYSLPTASTSTLGGVKIDGTSIVISSGIISTGVVTASGTYTPALTNTTNVASSSLSQAVYSRVGNIVTVTVSGVITATLGASTATTLTIALPINTATTTQTGVGVPTLAINAGGLGYMSGFASVNAAGTFQIYFDVTSTTSSNFAVTIQYHTD